MPSCTPPGTRSATSTWEAPRRLSRLVLGLPIQIKNDIDDSAALRRSCREGVCGSDSVNINGKIGLVCVAPIAQTRQPATC